MRAKIDGFRDSHDQLDLQREDNPHVGLGYGRHQCAGQQLARMELQIVLHTLLRRIPTRRLSVVTGAGSPVQGAHFAAAVENPDSRYRTCPKS
jgi:cytochrome P450